ncbi:hypothetical protein J6590_015618 [Homalodisca vitripennis]|nr:hypothetical protein J6590_015618 [Homalodisca vitripennis]
MTDVITTRLSDHKAQLCTVNFQTNTTPSPISTTRKYTQENLKHLKNILARESWDDVFKSNNVDEAYNFLNITLRLALNAACPQKMTRTKPKKKLTAISSEGMLNLKKRHLKALQDEILQGTKEAKARTAAKKKNYDLKLKQTKREATADYINKAANKQKALWRVIDYERCKPSNQTNQITLEVNNPRSTVY